MIDPKSEAWRIAAHSVITELAATNTLIVSDMVVSALEAANMGLNNYSALGGVFTRAAKAGVIAKTNETQPGNRKSHSAKTVWRSLTYQAAADTAPEANTVAAMVINALEYNAATIRYASFIYNKDGIDPKSLTKAIKDFNEMADIYQAKNIKLIEDLEAVRKEQNNVA